MVATPDRVAGDGLTTVTVTATGTPGKTCTLGAQTHRAWDPGAPGFDAAGADPDVGIGLRVSF